jgi:arylsulfatase A-like enzyme
MAKPGEVSRRELLGSAPVLTAAMPGKAGQPGAAQSQRPNIVVVISDQFRWDCIGAAGVNPMNLTPNLDEMARQGTMFSSAFCNQPVCAPARASMFTGQYPSKHGVWRNGIGLSESAVTLASTLRPAGYSTNYIGKWHLAGESENRKEVRGAVNAAHRGGFLDLWEGANALEWTSHPYEGDLFDNDGKPIHFQGIYRTDFMTDRAERFLRSAKSPFLLTLSYLEVHHQNDIDSFVPPKELATRYKNAFVPEDLRPLPGSWPSQLSDYYGCVAKMDETIGRLRRILRENGLERNTILVFLSDHACHFKTRNTEYKRSPHESSIHVPLIIEGPGFNRSMKIPELVSQVDLAPTLLAAAGIAVPESMQGHSVLPLLDRKIDGWRNEVYFEMSEYVTGRGLRTPQYTYAAAAPKARDWKAAPSAPTYYEYIVYDNYADPFQHTNLAGRATYGEVRENLRARLDKRIQEAGGVEAKVEPALFPYS